MKKLVVDGADVNAHSNFIIPVLKAPEPDKKLCKPFALLTLLHPFIFLLAIVLVNLYSLNMDIQNPHDKFFKAVFSEKEAAISYEGADRVMTIANKS